jgi:hypothetical protein
MCKGIGMATPQNDHKYFWPFMFTWFFVWPTRLLTGGWHAGAFARASALDKGESPRQP